MTAAQYKAIMEGKDFKKDVQYILAAENTKINSVRFAKIEIDESNDLLEAYVESPRSTKEKPVYEKSFVIAMENVLAIQFNPSMSDNELFNELNRTMLVEY